MCRDAAIAPSNIGDSLIASLGFWDENFAKYSVPREVLPSIAARAMLVKGKDDPIYPKILDMLYGLYEPQAAKTA